MDPEEFRVRLDLASVKVNATPENITRQTEALAVKAATAKASSSPESARHPSGGVYVRESMPAPETLPVLVRTSLTRARMFVMQ